MSANTTADEQPKRKIAKKVVAEKRKYFVPAHGVVVEASSPAAAVNLAKKRNSARKEGDG